MSNKIRNHSTSTVLRHGPIEQHLLTGTGDEMRRSLWTIMASARLLLRSRDLAGRNHRLVERIDGSAQRLMHIVRDLLDEALAHTGLAMPLSPAATDMRVIAEEAVTEAKINNPGRFIERSGVGSGAGEWDHDRVLQLVSNLLAHALDRSSESTAISLAWSGTAHGVFVEVDYEPDAPAADRDIGLGLSVARRIALAHGGDIRKSHTSSAARLRVDLPRLIPVRAEHLGAPPFRVVQERSRA